MDYVDVPASYITEVDLGKFCAGAWKTPEGKEALSDKRYTYDSANSLRSKKKERSDGKERFLVVRRDMMEACRLYGFKFKFVLSKWDTN